MIVLAIDPGVEKTGFAFFEIKNNKHSLLNYGLILSPKNLPIEKRLSYITQKILTHINFFHPDCLVLEQIFFYHNQKTQVAVAQSQGAILQLAGNLNLPVYFLTPLSIKVSVTGDGKADKKQVRKMVQLLLPEIKLPKCDDIVDAIACGLAFFYQKLYDRKN